MNTAGFPRKVLALAGGGLTLISRWSRVEMVILPPQRAICGSSCTNVTRSFPMRSNWECLIWQISKTKSWQVLLPSLWIQAVPLPWYRTLWNPIPSAQQ